LKFGGINAPFARGIAALEDDDYAQALVFDPLLEMAQFSLKLPQLLHVFLALQLPGVVWFGFLHE
jgi:hypothetical protein